MTLGDRLHSLRQSKGMTLRELALEVGTSEGFLSQLENDRTHPSLMMVGDLAHALGIKVSDMLAGVTIEPPRRYERGRK